MKAPCFILNGWAAASAVWQRCEVAREARIFSYLDQLDGRVEQALAALPPDVQITLVGWSMGGASALKLAAAHPERIARLVLLAATARMMADPAAGWKGMSPHRLEALRYGFSIMNPDQTDAPEDLARGIDFLRATDLRATLASVFPARATFPVAIFQSERDPIVRPENAACLTRYFPAATVTYVPGAEHALPALIPELIDAALRGAESAPA